MIRELTLDDMPAMVKLAQDLAPHNEAVHDQMLARLERTLLFRFKREAITKFWGDFNEAGELTTWVMFRHSALESPEIFFWFATHTKTPGAGLFPILTVVRDYYLGLGCKLWYALRPVGTPMNAELPHSPFADWNGEIVETIKAEQMTEYPTAQKYLMPYTFHIDMELVRMTAP